MGCEMIADEIRRRVPDADLPDPDPKNPDKWHRFPCPFCRRERAAINYAVNKFKCHHAKCGVTILTGKPAPDLIVVRFHFQIKSAVDSLWTSFAGVLKRHYPEAWQAAYKLVIEYDRAGLIDTWEADNSGDQNQVDRFMLRELSCDMKDWAIWFVRNFVRSGEDDFPDDYEDSFTFGDTEPPVEYQVIWNDLWRRWPYLDLRFRHGRTVEQIAEIEGVSSRTVKRQIAEEKIRARQTLETS
jgi:hypothetical protein